MSQGDAEHSGSRHVYSDFDCAWLHRRQRSTWIFTPCHVLHQLVHRTSRGGVYAILPGVTYGKPFWVGKLIGGAWCTVENHLRAREIEFGCGGRYMFPE